MVGFLSERVSNVREGLSNALYTITLGFFRNFSTLRGVLQRPSMSLEHGGGCPRFVWYRARIRDMLASCLARAPCVVNLRPLSWSVYLCPMSHVSRVDV